MYSCVPILSLAATLVFTIPITYAQYPPPMRYDTILPSPIDPRISISYKAVDVGTCSTVYSRQKQYSGYITLPALTLAPIQQNYSVNTFFWFVEARANPETAPLTIWLNGGPGSSSLVGLFNENGPCEVVQTSDGSYGTKARMWGWDRSSNMLYIDQPAQVGLSYDTLTNFSHDLLQDKFYSPASRSDLSTPSYAFLNGTFPSQKSYATSNTTQIAAHAVWHFLQGFLSTFPLYNPGVRPNSTAVASAGINLFTESYGGLYGPVFADLFEEQNDLRKNSSLLASNSLDIRIVSLGIINGAVDAKIQVPYYAKFAANNTYNIQAIDSKTMKKSIATMKAPGGCLEMLDACRTLMATQDPEAEGDVAAVNGPCAAASNACQSLAGVYAPSGRSVYDIRQKDPSPFPSLAYIEYLNSAQVQHAIGTPVNYTESSDTVNGVFLSTGDFLRDSQLPALSRLLQKGIRVAFLYGDADFICNWHGGEAVSLALAQLLPPYITSFPSAGYADIIVNSSYIGGAVRQFGNLSFARVYDSGHLIPAYQPETAFTIFTRIIQGTALSTGEKIEPTVYNTTGPQFSTKTNKAGSSKDPVCWVRSILTTCTDDQRTAMLGGKGVVIHGVWYASEDDYKPPTSSVLAGKPGTPAPNATTATSMKGSDGAEATGVYVATGTPKSTSGVVRLGYSVLLMFWAGLATAVSVILM
ncbi:alpha/beta-hydrolase [Tothia fuscella]|uniref:Alpha/beta-hydrolase n=1 Tax=Tothia fuscella TaxID=1048955 RepID=A0A9P4P0F3_9PEZI|nr:alpha/beta-hydrolase [Tothia fuscella]